LEDYVKIQEMTLKREIKVKSRNLLFYGIMWQCMPAIPALGRLRRGDHKLGCTITLSKNKKKRAIFTFR
jgi:hypothetical protein